MQIEKLEQSSVPTFKIIYTKTIKDLEGNDVVVVDEDKTEIVSKEYLLQQKQSYLDHLAVVNDKISRIEALE